MYAGFQLPGKCALVHNYLEDMHFLNYWDYVCRFLTNLQMRAGAQHGRCALVFNYLKLCTLVLNFLKDVRWF